MGKTLAQNFPSAQRVFEEADDALGFAISRLCFEGPEADLKLTENTQPALVAVSVAAYRVLSENGITARMVAGHSLGEYSALVAAGALPLGQAIRLVRNRGRYMQEAVPAGTGAMAALLKLPEQKLEEILAEAAQGEIVTAANFNSPEQVVIAGHTAAVARAMELAKTAGAKRAILLPVSAPFHCPLMRPAQKRMLPELTAATFTDLAIPLINNWQAKQINHADQARQGLFEQIPNPVQWRDTMQLFAAHGITRFIEVGPGNVLAGLVRGNLAGASTLPFGEAMHLAAVVAEMQET
jgi:[acyl-carrier-protein] S-malonyltransferase